MLSMKARERPLCEEFELLVDILLVLLFEHFEEQREFGHFNGLLVDIHTVDIV